MVHGGCPPRSVLFQYLQAPWVREVIVFLEGDRMLTRAVAGVAIAEPVPPPLPAVVRVGFFWIGRDVGRPGNGARDTRSIYLTPYKT